MQKTARENNPHSWLLKNCRKFSTIQIPEITIPK